MPEYRDKRAPFRANIGAGYAQMLVGSLVIALEKRRRTLSTTDISVVDIVVELSVSNRKVRTTNGGQMIYQFSRGR